LEPYDGFISFVVVVVNTAPQTPHRRMTISQSRATIGKNPAVNNIPFIPIKGIFIKPTRQNKRLASQYGVCSV